MSTRSDQAMSTQPSYVIANWKLNPATLKEAVSLAQSIQPATHCVVGVSPSFVHLSAVQAALDPAIALGVQTISAQTAQTGAFTGDVSASQATDLGATFVLIGHSECRQQGETEQILYNKIDHALSVGLSVVYCVGEHKHEYEAAKTQAVIANQLALLESFASKLTANTDANQFAKLLIAYEPIWAIGTGLMPSLHDIEQTHRFIKKVLLGFGICPPILYGGSVNQDNANDLSHSSYIDGVLVGGASLKAQAFNQIIGAFS